MSKTCTSCGFETKQAFYKQCIQCGIPFSDASPSAEMNEGTKAELAKVSIALSKNNTSRPSTRVPPEKDLVYWGYFVLFLPFILDGIHGRMPYREGSIGTIYFNYGKLIIPISIFLMHLVFFPERRRIGAVVGIALSALLAIVPTLFLIKYRKSIEFINEMHETVQRAATAQWHELDSDGIDAPIITYNRESMILTQTWISTEENFPDVEFLYLTTIDELKSKASDRRDFAKMFLYGLTYEINLRHPDGSQRQFRFGKSDVQSLFP